MRRKLYTPDLDCLSEFEKYNAKSDELSELFSGDPTLDKLSRTIYDCGDYLSFVDGSELLDDVDPGSGFVLYSASFCRARLCPSCQWRRSMRIYAQLSDLWASLMDQGFVVLHLVLTVANCPADQLTKTISGLFRSSSKYFRSEPLRCFRGVIRFLEVTFSASSGSFHPHLHCLLAVKPSYFHSRQYLSHDRLRELWRDALGVDYLPQVNIQRADDDAVREVSKYCVKPFDFDGLPPDQELDVYRVLYAALHGRRMIQTYGCIASELRRQKVDLDRDDIERDPIHIPIDRQSVFQYDHKMREYTPVDFR